MLVTGGFLLTYFQASVGLVFWEYQTGSLIRVIGHLATGYQTIKMPKAKYMSLNISLAEARAKAVFLRTQMQQKGCSCKASQFHEISDQLCEVLAYIQYKECLEEQLAKEGSSLHPSLPQINKTWTAPDLEALF